jgi:hypothetical protein
MSEKARHQAPSPILPKVSGMLPNREGLMICFFLQKNVPPAFTSREPQGSTEAKRTKPPGKNVLVSKVRFQCSAVAKIRVLIQHVIYSEKA